MSNDNSNSWTRIVLAQAAYALTGYLWRCALALIQYKQALYVLKDPLQPTNTKLLQFLSPRSFLNYTYLGT